MASQTNLLWQYVQSLRETVAQLSKPTVFQVMENNMSVVGEPTFRTVWCKCYYKSKILADFGLSYD